MNGQGAGVKAEQVKLEAMENGKAANKAPKAGADGKTVDPSGYDEKTKQKAERIVEKEKYKDVNFWQEHKKELWEMLPFLWPKDRPFIKLCMVLSVFFLLCSKLCNVASPIALKYAVDAVVKGEFSVEAILAYGLLRFAGQFFNELKDNAFAYVSTHASRKISLRTFTHVMGLSLRFHINRKTGSVIRACSRGSESFAALTPLHLLPGGAHLPRGGAGLRVPLDLLHLVLWHHHLHGHRRLHRLHRAIHRVEEQVQAAADRRGRRVQPESHRLVAQL
jgi:hypothetical protein